MCWRPALVAAVVLLAAGCVEPEEPLAADEGTVPTPPDPGPPLPTLPPLPPDDTDPQPDATPWEPGLYSFTLDVAGQAAEGLVAVPVGAPDTLVVVAHGWGGSAQGHEGDLRALAERGALAVAMDYRGPRHAFKVKAGIEDTVAATLFLQEAYPLVDRTLLYGWSMGGEIALLAPLQAPAGTFDYVFAGAGVMDLEVFYHENPLARADIENETGGPPMDHPAAYVERSPALRAAELPGRGVARVFLVHGAADWPVPLDHSERMYSALAEVGLPVSYYVVTKDRGSVCAPTQCVSPPVPAGHLAGQMRLMWPFIEHRIARATDPAEPALRGTYDGETGAYEPSDTGP